jgi:spore maturation protein CgeB
MKFLFVTRRYDYASMPTGEKGPWSFEYEVWYKTFLELFDGKHQVIPFWVDEVAYHEGKEQMNERLLELSHREKPTAAFFYLTNNELKKETIRKVTQQGVTTVYWCGDDSWKFDSTTKHYAPFYSWVVTLYSGAVEKYRRLGCKNIIHSQSAANTDIYKPTTNTKDIDVSFVGTWSEPRQKIMDELALHGVKVSVYGKGWPAGKVTQEQLVDIFSRSKISLGLNAPSFYFGWRPIARLFFKRADFVFEKPAIRFDGQHFFTNFREWFAKRERQIKARTFEICACRTLQMTQTADNLRDYYEIGKEIVVYDSVPDLVQLIRHYLAHPEETAAIAEAGYKRTIRDHSCKNRIKEIFKTIGVNGI